MSTISWFKCSNFLCTLTNNNSQFSVINYKHNVSDHWFSQRTLPRTNHQPLTTWGGNFYRQEFHVLLGRMDQWRNQGAGLGHFSKWPHLLRDYKLSQAIATMHLLTDWGSCTDNYLRTTSAKWNWKISSNHASSRNHSRNWQ